MTLAVRRFLGRVFKWVVIPIALCLIGYLFVGPRIADAMAIKTPAESAK